MTGIKGKRIILNKKKHNPAYEFIAPSYSPVSIFFRFCFSMVVAIIVLKFMVFYIVNTLETPKVRTPILWDYLRVTLYFWFVSEAQIIADRILEYFFPVPKNIRIRIFVQSVLGILLIMGVFFAINFIENRNPQYSKTVFYFGTSIGLIFITLISSSLLLIRLTRKWIASQKQIDDMKQEKLLMDYNSLQDQVNPHFLFNNLSVLKSLIIYDKDSAVKFTENFTDVYRYVLQSKDKRVVDLADEIEFIQSFVGLHKERLGNGISINFSIDENSNKKKIAPLTLQLLVENAIKHNITSKESPLIITIETSENHITVRNNLQLKETSYSTNTGLRNLSKRYDLLSKEGIEITESQDEFCVVVPFIKNIE